MGVILKDTALVNCLWKQWNESLSGIHVYFTNVMDAYYNSDLPLTFVLWLKDKGANFVVSENEACLQFESEEAQTLFLLLYAHVSSFDAKFSLM